MEGTYTVHLKSKRQLTKDAWQFIFSRPQEVTFLPGQYITIFLEKDNRDFTIASSPLQQQEFFIITKQGISDFKKKLFVLPEGEKVIVGKPSGGFLLKESSTPKVFLAGGIGMTPFYSMIVSYSQTEVPLILIASFSKKEDIIFFEELKKIEKWNQLIKIIYTLSQDMWEGDMGRISGNHIKKHVPNFRKSEYMIAGGERMVEDTEKLLQNMGIQEEKIRIDIFTGY